MVYDEVYDKLLLNCFYFQKWSSFGCEIGSSLHFEEENKFLLLIFIIGKIKKKTDVFMQIQFSTKTILFFW